jgi:hypothetical protein
MPGIHTKEYRIQNMVMMEHWDKLSLKQIVLEQQESHLEQGK